MRSGEQRPATILMTDLCGFTGLSEGSEPEWVFQLVNEIFHDLGEVLAAHGGYIDKYVGDEVIALFGVPLAQEKAVERALRSALSMRERLEGQAQQGRYGAVHPQAHTGINLGPVMVGPVGHRDRADYTVIGDAVNVAKRLEEAAPPGEIYVSSGVREVGDEGFRFEAVGPLPVKGRREPVEAYRLMGTRRRVPLFGAKAASVFVGREAELQALGAAAGQAASGQQTTVYVLGPAGIGKSSLLQEWMRRGGADGFQIASTNCYVFGEHFPLLPVIDLAAQLLGLQVEGWPPRVTGDVEGALHRLGLETQTASDLQSLLSWVGQTLGREAPRPPEALPQALAALLAAVGRAQRTCLLLEDVQWLDETSRQVLGQLLAGDEHAGLLTLMTGRDAGDDLSPGDVDAHTVHVPPLTRRQIEQLIEAWAAPVLPSAAMKRAICDAAQGHPYFARELVRSLGRGGSPAGAPKLPSSIQELFLSRLDALPTDLRRLVQAASVMKEPLSYGMLEAALGSEIAFSEEMMRAAVSAGLLRLGTARGQFTFGPRLLFDAAYETIPSPERRTLHARIAFHLQDLLDTLGESAVHAASYHAYMGYHDERALDLLVRSGRLYRAQYASRQALVSTGRALELITSLPYPEEYLELRVECLLLTAQSYQVLDELEEAEGALAEAEILGEDCQNRELVAQVLTMRATLGSMQGQVRAAYLDFSRAREEWEKLGVEERVAHALLGMGVCARQEGRREEAASLFAQAARRSAGALWVKAAALNNAGMLLLSEGRYEEAEAGLREGLQANQEDDDRRGVAHCQASLGELCLRLGRGEEAEKWLQAALAQAQEIEDSRCVDLGMALLARAQAAQGRREESAATLQSLAPAEPVPETAAHRRMAELELEIAAAGAGATGSPGQRSAPQPGAALWKEPGVASLELCAELLCVELEAALVRGDAEGARELGAALGTRLRACPDRRLQAYARWLLRAAQTAAPRLQPYAGSRGKPAAGLELRSRRLLAALGRGT